MKQFAIIFLLSGVVLAAEPLRDPTRPAWTEPVASESADNAKPKIEPAAELAGILYSPQRQVVMFNQRYYRVGDRIGQQTLQRIERDRIWLRHDGRDISMQLPIISGKQKTQKVERND